MTKNSLKPYTFTDGDFSMEINVSEEERTIYMSQKEIALLLGVGLGTVSKKLKKYGSESIGIFSKISENGKHGRAYSTKYYSLEIIK